MLVVGDLDEVFVPSLDLLVRPTAKRAQIETLLDRIPDQFAESVNVESALGSAIRGGLATLVNIGSIIQPFSCILMFLKGRSWRSSCFLPVITTSHRGWRTPEHPSPRKQYVRHGQRKDTPRPAQFDVDIDRRGMRRGRRRREHVSRAQQIHGHRHGVRCAQPDGRRGVLAPAVLLAARRGHSAWPAEPAGITYARVQLHGARAVLDWYVTALPATPIAVPPVYL